MDEKKKSKGLRRAAKAAADNDEVKIGAVAISNATTTSSTSTSSSRRRSPAAGLRGGRRKQQAKHERPPPDDDNNNLLIKKSHMTMMMPPAPVTTAAAGEALVEQQYQPTPTTRGLGGRRNVETPTSRALAKPGGAIEASNHADTNASHVSSSKKCNNLKNGRGLAKKKKKPPPPGAVEEGTTTSVCSRGSSLLRETDKEESLQSAKTTTATTTTHHTNSRRENKKTTRGLAQDNGDTSGKKGQELEQEKPSTNTNKPQQQEQDKEMPTSNNEPAEPTTTTHTPSPKSLTTTPLPPTLMRKGDSCLAIAKPVEEDDDDVALPIAGEAEQVDPQKLKKQEIQQNERKKCRRIGMGIVAICCIVLTITLGLTLSGNNEEKRLRIPPPTMAPSTAPSGTPSAAPSNVMDELLALLPNHTLASLNDYDSPQSKAFSWISSHQNITNLPAWRKEQLFALSTFYYAMQGPNWPSYASDGWLDDTVSECLWFSSLTGYVLDGKWIEFENLNDVEDYYGSHQCNEQGQIHTIHLSQLGLGNYTPFVPPEIGLLSSLEKLYLGENDIAVSVDDMLPTQFGQLQHLLYIDFSWNAITGTIPSAIGLSLTNLPMLSLDGNSITGTLPSQMGLLTNMTSFHCPYNNIHGSIPTEFGLLTDMTYLAMSGNELTGAIPAELGLMRGMENFYALDNQFTVLPSELGLWTDLKQILLSRNSLSGTLPTQIGLWSQLDYLWLEENYFSGQIPSHLGMMNITYIKLNGNSLTGAIPSQLGLLQSLDFLFLSNNSLSGPLPSELGLLVNLKELHISHNPLLGGTIPEEIGNLVSFHNLGVVVLAGSINLEGQIPEEVCFLQSPNCTYLPWPSNPCSLEFDCVGGGGNGSDGFLCGCDCSCIDR